MKIKFAKNFPLGIFLGCILTIGLLWAIDATDSEELKKFYTYIFSALITLIAASVALAGVLTSLQHQTILREDERKRKLSAARAFLPLALTQMCEVSKLGMQNSYRARKFTRRDMPIEFKERSLREIQLTDQIIAVFREIVEHSSDDAGILIQGILREYQVFYSRWKSHIDDTENLMEPDIEEVAFRTTSWAFLHCLTQTAFDYARGYHQEIVHSVTAEGISTILDFSNCHTAIAPKEFHDAASLYERHYQRRFYTP